MDPHVVSSLCQIREAETTILTRSDPKRRLGYNPLSRVLTWAHDDGLRTGDRNPGLLVHDNPR
jgi:hypothetical protein